MSAAVEGDKVEVSVGESVFVPDGGFLKWGIPKSSIFNGISQYKPSSYWGTPMAMETPMTMLAGYGYPSLSSKS